MIKTRQLIKLLVKDSYEGLQTFLITVGAVMVVALAIALKDSWQVGGAQLYNSVSLAIGIPVVFGLVLYVIMAYVKSVQSWQNAKLVLLPATKWQFVISNLVVRLLVILINVAVVTGIYRLVMLVLQKALNAAETDNAMHFSWNFGHVEESTGAIVLVFLFVNFIGLAVNLGVTHFMPRLKHAKGVVFIIAFLVVFLAVSLGETYLVDWIGLGYWAERLVDGLLALGFFYGIFKMYTRFNDAF
ncbi:hypothetical protein [Weissella confusa]|uniref:hypothetical protein n=1 Tax=Weissella confusa TaxID=1583 RepID=UPI0022E808B1|nr:hypothetical protein [Weissella confusa]